MELQQLPSALVVSNEWHHQRRIHLSWHEFGGRKLAGIVRYVASIDHGAISRAALVIDSLFDGVIGYTESITTVTISRI